jgi:class 3 adenylate cyclase
VNSLTFSIGSLIIKCKFEVERANGVKVPLQADGNLRQSRGIAGPKSVTSQRVSHSLNGENCTVFLTDVVGFGARTRNDKDRRIIREALFGMTYAALQDMPDAWSEDCGDGLLTVIPPAVSTAKVMNQLLAELPAALERHNCSQGESAQFQLRFAVNVGPVVSDAMGVSGEAIIDVARLVEAPSFKQALARSTANLGVIASPFVYDMVIRHGANPHDAASYTQVPVEVKESATTAWMKLFDVPVPSPLPLEVAVHDVQADMAQDGMRESAGDRPDHRKAFPLIKLDRRVIRFGHGVELHSRITAFLRPGEREAAHRRAHATAPGLGRHHETSGRHM